MHYFQFNIGDYASHTRHLSLMEDLAYRRMLDTYYLHEQALPEDPIQVARIIGMREFAAEVEQVLADFFELSEEGWCHSRADREIAQYQAFLDKQRENGKRGGRPRKNPDETHRKPTANPSQTQTEPKKSLTTNHKPLTNNQSLSSKDDCASGDAPEPDEDFSVHDFVESWNAIASECGLASIRKLTDSRRRAFNVRRREYPNMDDWKRAFQCLRTTKWMHGENRNGWRADPDFFLQAKSFTKLVEGQYAQADRP
jgi:uncharacterized protein YdaU (DUF1376 family)